MTKNQDEINLALMQKDIKYIKDAFDDLALDLKENYATKAELRAVDQKYRPIQQIIYSAVGLIITTVFLALLALVVVSPK